MGFNVGDFTKALVPGHKDYLDFGGSPNHTDWRAIRARNRRKNMAADEFSELSRSGRGILNRISYFDEVGDKGRADVLRARAAKRGVNLDTFAGQGNAEDFLLNLGSAGGVYGQRAGILRNRLDTVRNTKEAEKVAGLAGTEIPDDISRSYQQTLNQIAALTGGDPNSPAVQAAAAQAVQGRFEALDRAQLDIQKNLSAAKIAINQRGSEFDIGLLSSIGNTIEMLRAQQDADKMAQYQLGASGIGMLGGLGLGLAGLLGGGAAATAGGAVAGGAIPGFRNQDVTNMWAGTY